jgi:hypothetical protein
MIACIDKAGRVSVSGTVKEWVLFLERLDLTGLCRTDESDRAREILIIASAVPFNGIVQNKRGR